MRWMRGDPEHHARITFHIDHTTGRPSAPLHLSEQCKDHQVRAPRTAGAPTACAAGTTPAALRGSSFDPMDALQR